MATNVDGYIKAEGGDKAGAPAESIINPGLPGFTEQEAFSGSNAGDPEAAKALLEEAGVTLPYPITFTYGQSETAGQDRGCAQGELGEGWLQGQPSTRSPTPTTTSSTSPTRTATSSGPAGVLTGRRP